MQADIDGLVHFKETFDVTDVKSKREKALGLENKFAAQQETIPIEAAAGIISEKKFELN